eukprot:11188278-Lingulodinium_polyedra.AAC.1
MPPCHANPVASGPRAGGGNPPWGVDVQSPQAGEHSLSGGKSHRPGAEYCWELRPHGRARAR